MCDFVHFFCHRRGRSCKSGYFDGPHSDTSNGVGQVPQLNLAIRILRSFPLSDLFFLNQALDQAHKWYFPLKVEGFLTQEAEEALLIQQKAVLIPRRVEGFPIPMSAKEVKFLGLHGFNTPKDGGLSEAVIT